jgi:hypothetical protein
MTNGPETRQGSLEVAHKSSKGRSPIGLGDWVC